MIVKEVNGISRGFRFGTFTFKILEEDTGVDTVEEVFSRLHTGNQKFLSAFFFACAKHYSLSRKEKVNFDEVEISDWMDDLGYDGAIEIFDVLIKTYSAKNQQAPATGQGQEVLLKTGTL